MLTRAGYVTLSREEPLAKLPHRERLWAALERQTANNPRRSILHAAARTLRAAARGEPVATGVLLRAHAVVALQRAFHFFSPSRQRVINASHYTPFHVYVLVIVTLTAFAFMAGAYPYWLQHTGRNADRPAEAPAAGSVAMWRWVASGGAAWRTFSPYYLVRHQSSAASLLTAVSIPHAVQACHTNWSRCHFLTVWMHNELSHCSRVAPHVP
jgi:hypothetical protein